MGNVRTVDLVTKDDVANALLRSDEADVIRDKALADDSEFENEALDTIESASDRVRDRLSRDLIVAEQVEYTATDDWQHMDAHPVDPNNLPYQFWTREWPVLAVVGTSESTATTMIGRKRKKIWTDGDGLTYVNYIAGYKRPDQSLSDFDAPVTDELSAGEIPDLPETIRNVTENIVIHRLVERLSGLIGVSQSEVSYGNFENTKTKRESDQDYEERLLRSLNADYAALA